MIISHTNHIPLYKQAYIYSELARSKVLNVYVVMNQNQDNRYHDITRLILLYGKHSLQHELSVQTSALVVHVKYAHPYSYYIYEHFTGLHISNAMMEPG